MKTVPKLCEWEEFLQREGLKLWILVKKGWVNPNQARRNRLEEHSSRRFRLTGS